MPRAWCVRVRTQRLGTAACLAGALVISACGSTSPSAPSPVSSPPAQYPAVVGHWANGIGSSLMLHYRGTATTDGWTCTAMVDVPSQTGGTFAGGVSGTATGSSEP